MMDLPKGIPTGVGDAKAQEEFLRNNDAFLREYPQLHKLLAKVFVRVLDQTDNALGLEGDAARASEDKSLAQIVVFYLGRAAADDFAELIILSGNGRGIGAFKILRGMYERIVTAAFISENPSEARLFLANVDIQKGKLWKRLVDAMPAIKDRYTPEQIKDLENRVHKAHSELKTGICTKCHQPITQDAWTRASVDTMAQKVNFKLAELYGPCYLLPTFHSHATAFGLESRLRETNTGYSFQESSEGEARRALLLGHNLILQLLWLQNSYFGLGLDADVKTQFEMFQKIWDNSSLKQTAQ
jgi:Family of unknown function (DUF5677)